jgi:hypothetical protein
VQTRTCLNSSSRSFLGYLPISILVKVCHSCRKTKSAVVSFSDLPVSLVAHHMETDLKSGLSTEEVENRMELYGKNELPSPNPSSIFV